MKFDIEKLRHMIREEVKSSKNLSEAMNRITPEEIEAWKGGNWGFVSDPMAQMDVGMHMGEDPDRFLHGKDHMDDEGSMVKSSLYSMKKMAAEVCDLLNSGDQLPGWVQDHISVARENLQQVHGYLVGKQHSVEMGTNSIGMSESKRTLKESHSRITKEEMDAWLRGDWGFESVNESSEKSPKYHKTRDELETWHSDLSKETLGIRDRTSDPHASLEELEAEIDSLLDPKSTVVVNKPEHPSLNQMLQAKFHKKK